MMNRMSRYTGSLCLVLVLAACASPAPQTGAPAANNNLYATLYLRSAAEYEALGQTVYNAAGARLDEAVHRTDYSAALEQNNDFSRLPPGIIVDVDETVLDNSAYQATLVARNITYTTPHWDKWVAQAQAGAVPGAVQFARRAELMGVTMLYLTNRRCIQRVPGGDPCPQRAETINNLVKTGFPAPDPANVYLRSAEFGFASDKGSRRKALAERFRIIMLFGDDLGDFISGIKDPGTTRADREAAVAQNGTRWGREWFVLPNPSYGSWLDVLDGQLYESLEPWRADPDD